MQHTAERGGAPDHGAFKTQIDGISTVITVPDCDALTGDKYTGWRLTYAQARLTFLGLPFSPPPPYAKLTKRTNTPYLIVCQLQVLRACLQEMRQLKILQQIDGEPFSVCVYREGHKIYFDAYSAIASTIYATSIHTDDVSGLLVPNYSERDAGCTIDAPTGPVDMYRKLARLLKFETFSNRKSKSMGESGEVVGGSPSGTVNPYYSRILVCKKAFSLLSIVNIVMGSRTVRLSCFEASIGDKLCVYNCVVSFIQD